MEMFITKQLLKACLPYAKDADISKFLSPLNLTFEKYKINTPKRIAAFLAQIAHESGSLKYVEEIASGSAYDTGRLAKILGNTPEDDGDGERYKGRGLIQITGRTNYEAVGKALHYDFINQPEHLKLPGAATLSAGWFWDSRKLNNLADLGTEEAFNKITKKINGGYNGKEDRLKHWERCKEALENINTL
jgi:putative chitinase